MVSVSDATAIIFDNLFRPEIRHVNIEDSTGKVLAETITADRDLPPFNRVSMDGIAIAYSGGTKEVERRWFVLRGDDRCGASGRL
jgi:molybdopterin molybdotransferase